LVDGGWFCPDSATQYGERTTFDGRNRISLATGTQWEHEAVYRTRRGRWILCEWSQWQGSLATYREISETDAAEWLIRHGHHGAADRIGGKELET
jgi:hypothetical protein